MQFIQFAVENILILTILASAFITSTVVGFLGGVVGQYRADVGRWSIYHFGIFYLEKEKELWVAHYREGIAVTMALLIMGHTGFILGPLLAISGAKKVRPLPVVDRRKMTR